jgi:hypothetical protein
LPVLYRVFPHLRKGAEQQPGGALYIPPQGGGRLDNPGSYAVLYLSDSAAGAIAEAFGRFPEWTPAILTESPNLPGSKLSLARYRLPDDAPLCDLDDAAQLAQLHLRPSDIVSRDYMRTRSWARGIYDLNQFVGIRWWSYYDPRWASVGLWETGQLVVEDVKPLRLDEPALLEAGRTIVRRVIPFRR